MSRNHFLGELDAQEQRAKILMFEEHGGKLKIVYDNLKQIA